MTIPDPPAKITLSAKEITPDPFAAYGQTHAIGATVRGTVKAITDKYAYVDLGADVDGAIHVSKLAHQPVERVSEVLAVGDEVEVRIVGFNAQRRQVELSRKALLPPPYEAFKAMHSVGDVVRGVVRGTNDSFAYIDLHGGVNGAIHVSKLATHKVAHPTDFVTIGSTVEATILGFKDDRKQVELSLQAVPPTAARTPPQPSRARPPAQPPASLTVEGETVDSAIDTACAQLGVRRESVTWEVLDPGAPGRFLRRKRPAKVRVTRR
jgi:ribosomal protein S1